MSGKPEKFLDHLEDLRKVLLKIIAVTLILAIPCWFLAPAALDSLLKYAAPGEFRLHYFALMEPFFVRLKLTALLALVLAAPWNAGQLWGFISPGLLPKERKILALPVLVISLLALGGAALAAFIVAPALLRFSLSFAGEGLEPVIGIGEFTDLVLMVILAGMLLFQFPVVIYLLLKLGIVQEETIRNKRPLLIVLIFTAAAVFSPPDAFSQIALAIPTWLLLELSLWLFARRGRYPAE